MFICNTHRPGAAYPVKLNRRILFPTLFTLLALSVNTPNAGGAVPDYSFEETFKEQKTDKWKSGKRKLEGNAEITSKNYHSAPCSLNIKSASKGLSVTDRRPYGDINFSTRYLPCPPFGASLKYSLWMKGLNIVSPGSYFKARFTVYFYNKEHKPVKHHELVCIDGTFDWKEFKGTLPVPENADYFKIICSLTHCSGEVWFDDIKINVIDFTAKRNEIISNLSLNDKITLIPKPWKTNFTKSRTKINEAALHTVATDTRVNPLLRKILNETGVNCNSPGQPEVSVITGDSANKTIAEAFSKEFPGNKWNELGTQGYFLCVNAKAILIGANTEQGRFYAVQTLRQLITKEGENIFVTAVGIIDRPTIERRGIAMGVSWFRNRDEAFKRMVRLKLNFVWNGGHFLGNGLMYGADRKATWRNPFPDQVISFLKEYLELCRKNFIEVAVAFSPKGYPPTHYSSDTDINILCGKMKVLYKAGVRNMGISFDDLQNIGQNRLYYEDDIKKFNGDLGKAHLFFVTNIYNRIKGECPDVKFTILPYIYGGLKNCSESEIGYLKTLSRIPADIKLWVVCLYNYDDVKRNLPLTGRSPFIWDNFFATGQLPAFPSPIDRSNKINGSNVSGYIFLPAICSHEDAAGISWLNMADYLWSPERYAPEDSYKRAIAFIAGDKVVLERLKEYSIISKDINSVSTLAARNEKIKFMRKIIAELDTFSKKTDDLPKNLAQALKKDILKQRKKFNSIIANLGSRPFYPVIIPKAAGFTDDNPAMDNFIPLGNAKRKIEDSKAWFRYDEKNLYVKIVCNEPDAARLKATEKKRDENVFHDDSVEIFIMPEKENESGEFVYYQFVINPLGTIYDARNIYRKYENVKTYDKDWNGNIKVKINKGAGFWELETAIPFSDLKMPSPCSGKKLFMNICRNRYAGRKPEHSSYALLLTNKYHSPKSFWLMELK
ncbi:MAG: beta-N-acetylglucosaminidase domain-containing protein [Victivallaceae bacterium]|nr:beta-N-acetylglucosaminidase domain-containing protein [Victivallaceae bacterium]